METNNDKYYTDLGQKFYSYLYNATDDQVEELKKAGSTSVVFWPDMVDAMKGLIDIIKEQDNDSNTAEK